MAGPPDYQVDDCSFGNVRRAIELAEAGAPVKLEGNVAMTVNEAYAVAMGVLRGRDSGIRVYIDDRFVYFECA